MCLITNISHGSVPVSVGNGTPREGRELVSVMKFPKSRGQRSLIFFVDVGIITHNSR